MTFVTKYASMRYALHPVLNLGETETVRDNFNDTPEALEKYYDSFREMFNTDGWQNLCNDFKDNAECINSVESTKGIDDLNFRKGQLAVISTLLNLENYIKSMEEEHYKSYLQEAGVV